MPFAPFDILLSAALRIVAAIWSLDCLVSISYRELRQSPCTTLTKHYPQTLFLWFSFSQFYLEFKTFETFASRRISARLGICVTCCHCNLFIMPGELRRTDQKSTSPVIPGRVLFFFVDCAGFFFFLRVHKPYIVFFVLLLPIREHVNRFFFNWLSGYRWLLVDIQAQYGVHTSVYC